MDVPRVSAPGALVSGSGKDWSFPGACVAGSSFVGTFMARDALALAATALRLTPADIVSLPAYLCKEVLRPFIGRSRPLFYDVGADLSVDPGEIAEVLANQRVRLLVLINYFGRLQPARHEIADLCQKHGALLLEDCAHSLLTRGSGDVGHLAVVSYRKLLPVWDGGGLFIRPGLRLSTWRLRPRLLSDALSLMARAKSALRIRSGVFSRAGMADVQESLGPPAVSPGPPVLPLSRMTERRLRKVTATGQLEQRQRDYDLWSGLVNGLQGLRPLFGQRESGMCPLGFPVVAKDRDALAEKLQSRGIPSTVHWRLSPAVGADCRVSHAISMRVLTLPVHPDLTPAMRAHIEAVGEKVLNSS